jgi:predicted small secreted protein
MKTFRLTLVVVASALSLASANAMPGLGRETGRFIRNDGPAPKGVRTFEPAESKDSKTGLENGQPANLSDYSPWLAFLVSLHPPQVACVMPLRPPQVACVMPLRPPQVACVMPLRPPQVACVMPLRPPHVACVMPVRPPRVAPVLA